MKRKPNKPRPEFQTHTEPGNGAAEPEGSAFGAGSEQEPGAAGTSGQSVPKSKFRQKSQQEQAAASKLRMEKRGEKREAAREKLAKQKPPKQKGPIRKAAGAAGWSVHGFVHGKLYEVEQENVGTEGAHRSELAGEVVLRHGSRFVKRKVREHPARAASRAEARYQKAAADYHSTPPHRSTRSFSKTILPGTGRNSGLEGNTRSGRRRPQNRAQKPPGKQPPPRKS